VSQILVVEDETRISSFVTKGLRAAGYASAAVTTGREGYDLAQTGDYDLMILDLGLPDQDGFTVLRRLRASRSTIPVIILTARSSVTDTVAGLEGGADDYGGADVLRFPAWRYEGAVGGYRWLGHGSSLFSCG